MQPVFASIWLLIQLNKEEITTKRTNRQKEIQKV